MQARDDILPCFAAFAAALTAYSVVASVNFNEYFLSVQEASFAFV